MGPEVSVPFFQNPTTGPLPVPDKFSPQILALQLYGTYPLLSSKWSLRFRLSSNIFIFISHISHVLSIRSD